VGWPGALVAVVPLARRPTLASPADWNFTDSYSPTIVAKFRVFVKANVENLLYPWAEMRIGTFEKRMFLLAFI
jgi:hypothetical protein